MKKAAASILAVCAAGLFAVTPHVDMKIRKRDNGWTVYSRDVYLNNAKLILRHTTADGKNTVSKKWGEVFFGLEFGRLPRTGGGWGIRDFFRCFEFNRNACNLVRERVPALVAAQNIGGTAVADLEFPSMNGGKLKIRMMQFPSHPEWIFMRVKSVNFNIWRFDFQAYPFQSDFPTDRERRARTEKGDFNVNRETVKIAAPSGHYLALYNKFTQDTAGNFLIIQPEKIKLAEIPKCRAAVNIRLYARKGFSQFDFALGCFKNQPASEAVSQFFSETGDAVRKFMDDIDWDPKMNTDHFDRSFAEAKRLGLTKARLEPLRQAYRKAVEKNDPAAAAEAEKKLDRLKKDAVASGLSEFM